MGHEGGCGFDNITESHELARALADQRAELAGYVQTHGGVELMRAYSDLTDALVKRILHIAAIEAESQNPSARRKASREIAMVAVGGYGRREMSPHSDVDVTFIVGGEEDDDIDAVIKRAFRILMDVLESARLKVGYSYRRVDDVENLSLDIQTALLDARLVAGNSAVSTAFHTALRAAIAPAAFVGEHVRIRNNPGSSLDTPYTVEPNIKEGRGGLRDLHTARWIAQIAFKLNGENVWNGLRARGVLLDGEIKAVAEAVEFIARTRNNLHILTGRGQEVLAVSRHAEIGTRMGFGEASEETARKFIAAYFQHSRELWRIYHKIAEACLGQELEIEPGVVAKSGSLHILDKGLLARDSAALIRLFQHAQSYNLRIHREADDLITAAAVRFKLTPAACRSFVDILANPGAAESLRAMAELGVLQAIVPGFGKLMTFVPGDAAHKFTVGEHSLRSLENLDKLFAENNDQFVDIFSRLQNTEVLFLATLMHDIGKLDVRRDHSRTGAAIAHRFAAHLGMSKEECERVEFLVKHHLRMGETARLRDMNQRRTIRDFISVVKDPQLLDMLLLLTIADSRAVGMTNWSQVQARFLLELHERAMAALRSPHSEGPDIDRHRKRVRRELSLANVPGNEIDEHTESMPASYLLNTSPDDLAAHIGYVRTVRGGSPAIELKDDRAGQFTLLAVVAKDKQGLLSEIAGVVHAMNIDVHAAQIFTRRSPADDIAIDILYIDFEGRQLTEMKKWQLEAGLTDVLNGAVGMDDFLAQWGKKRLEKLEGVSIRVCENLSDHETVLEVRAVDVPGILHHFTRIISEQHLNIHSARVATWGHEAHDVFYVTDRNGAKLSDNDLASLENAFGAG